MKIFLLGAEARRSLGYTIGQRLIEQGHTVCALARSAKAVDNVVKGGMKLAKGELADAVAARKLERADAVIDVRILVVTKERELVRDRSTLLKALEGSGRLMIATSSRTIFGNTGPTPLRENATFRVAPSSGWLRRLERQVLEAETFRGVVIRPALQYGQGMPLYIHPLISLCRSLRRGVYIGAGANVRSAVHFEDLADLFCFALQTMKPGLLLHAASQTFSMRQLAASIHQGFGFRGEPESLSIKEARKLTPFADSYMKNSAMSGDLAKQTLGWQPDRVSLLEEVESRVAKWMGLSRR
jgi:nucleoside-diphosphate-sugar epimerase